MSEKNQPKSFEVAYQRLEEILNLMNQGGATLEESLNLYIEADNLMKNCSEKLANAEQKIEQLIKDRSGKIEESNGQATTKPFKQIPTL